MLCVFFNLDVVLLLCFVHVHLLLYSFFYPCFFTFSTPFLGNFFSLLNLFNYSSNQFFSIFLKYFFFPSSSSFFFSPPQLLLLLLFTKVSLRVLLLLTSILVSFMFFWFFLPPPPTSIFYFPFGPSPPLPLFLSLPSSCCLFLFFHWFFSALIWAQIFSAGPSLMFMLVIRWSSVSSSRAWPSISCSLKASATSLQPAMKRRETKVWGQEDNQVKKHNTWTDPALKV